MADIVASQHALAGDGAASGHDRTPSWLNLLGNRPPTWRPRPDPENEPGLYGTGRRRSSPAGGRRRLVQAGLSSQKAAKRRRAAAVGGTFPAMTSASTAGSRAAPPGDRPARGEGQRG